MQRNILDPATPKLVSKCSTGEFLPSQGYQEGVVTFRVRLLVGTGLICHWTREIPRIDSPSTLHVPSGNTSSDFGSPILISVSALHPKSESLISCEVSEIICLMKSLTVK